MRKKLSLLLLLILIPALAYGWGIMIVGGGKGAVADYCTDSANPSAAFQERFECGAVNIAGDADQEYASWTVVTGTPDAGSTDADATMGWAGGSNEALELDTTEWEEIRSASATDTAEVWTSVIFSVNNYTSAVSVFLQIKDNGNTSVCKLKIADDGSIYLQPTGGTDTDTGVDMLVDTRYFVKVRAKAGSGANAECECWISTDPAAWGASEGNIQDGSWTNNPRKLALNAQRTDANNFFKDVLWSATEAHISYVGKGY